MAHSIKDLNLPTSVVTRIIKECLPAGVNISNDARIAIAKAGSVFVLYSTSIANNVALKSKRKTLIASDVLAAIEEMDMNTFVEPLKVSLEAFRAEQKEKKEGQSERKRQQAKEDEDDGEAEPDVCAANDGTNESDASEEIGHVVEKESGSNKKRKKTELN